MATTNATVRRWENGGLLTINNGTAYDISNIVRGTVEITDAFPQPIMYHDRATPQVPLVGDTQYGEARFSINAGKFDGTELWDILTAAASPASNLVREFTVTVKIPTYGGAATGESLTIADAHLAEPPKWKAGTELDTVDFVLRFRTKVVTATY